MTCQEFEETRMFSNSIKAVSHADVVETPDGWRQVCLAIRPQSAGPADFDWFEYRGEDEK